jgi:hypothetical protein
MNRQVKLVSSTSSIANELEATLIDGTWDDGLCVVVDDNNPTKKDNLKEERIKWIDFKERARLINNIKAQNQAHNIIQHIEMVIDDEGYDYD